MLLNLDFTFLGYHSKKKSLIFQDSLKHKFVSYLFSSENENNKKESLGNFAV